MSVLSRKSGVLTDEDVEVVVLQIERSAGPDGTAVHVFPASQRITGHSACELLVESHFLERMAHAEDREKEELRRVKEAAVEANRAKDRLLADVSHELRTPMNAILGMLELALDEELTPNVRDHLQTAKHSADALLALLNQILDFSRIESGKIILESVPFSLRTVVEETRKTFSLRAVEKGLTLACEFSADVPDRLVGDPLRVWQVLVNLIGNAIKFTAHGGITVRASVHAEGPQNCLLEFVVSDTGVGISAADQQRIFAPFVQADSSTARNYGGTGLGLAIACNLVGVMGGRMWVESEPGRGSHFHFTARFDKSPDVADAPTAGIATGNGHDRTPRPSRSLKVLLAEDNPANQKVALYFLGKFGHAVQVAPNGQDAIGLLQQDDFDIVLMDVQMPIMDGFEATAAIRSLEDSRKAQVPIVAMTAHATKGDEDRCLAAGMDAYVSKPINAQKLMELAEKLTSPAESEEARTTTAIGSTFAALQGDAELAALAKAGPITG